MKYKQVYIAMFFHFLSFWCIQSIGIIIGWLGCHI